jgi:uncharacterized OsmC-like protein
MAVTARSSTQFQVDIRAGWHRFIADRCPVHRTLTGEVKIRTEVS